MNLTNNKVDYRFFDLLRTIAAIAVVLSHIRDLILIDYRGGSFLTKAFYLATGLGHQAVMLFFVISGFWIAKTVSRRLKDDSWSWSTYLVDRLTRLWIVLIPALLIGAVLDIVGIYGLHLHVYLKSYGAHSIVEDIAPKLTLSILLGNVFFLQGLLTSTFGSNGALWSLANEFWYYIWFASIFLFLSRKSMKVVVLVAVLFSVLTMFLFRSLLPGFGCWLCGAFTYLMGIEKRKHKLGGWLFPLALLFTIVAVAVPKVLSRAAGDASDMLIAICCACMISTWSLGRLQLPSWMNIMSSFGARSSYSLYLTHFPVVLLLVGVTNHDGREGMSVKRLISMFSLFVLALAYSFVFSLLTERRTPAFRRAISHLIGFSGSSHLGEASDGVVEAGQSRPS